VKPNRITPRVAFWALAALTLLVSHDLVWLVQLGPGESLTTALRTDDHGYWTWLSLAILALATVAALGVATRAIGLVRRVRRLDATVARVRGRHFLARSSVAWAELLAVVGIGFAVQENVEHYLSHGHVLGTGAVTGPEYPLAIPVLAVATAIAALVCAAVRTIERELVDAIESALRRSDDRAPRRVRLRARCDPPRRPAAMSGSVAGRAPPPLLATT
jgi:hypothetical protein